MNLQQAVERRLHDIRDEVESGATEHTGRAMRYSEEEGGGYTGRRMPGLKPSFPELYKLKEGPGKIAAAIRSRGGDAMLRKGFAPQKKRSAGRPTVPPHDGRSYCSHCREFHAKGQHRFHGAGSFHRTHLFSFGGMNPPGTGRGFTFHGSFTSKILAARREREIPGSFIREKNGRFYVLKPKKAPPAPAKNPPSTARRVFVRLMERSQVRELSARERAQLRAARAILKRQARVKKNPAGRPWMRGNLVRLGRLVELRYHRTEGRKPGFYRHPFKVRPEVLYNPRNNQIIIQG